MAEEDQDKTEENGLKNDTENAEVQKRQDENGKIRSIRHLSGMFETWFLD